MAAQSVGQQQAGQQTPLRNSVEIQGNILAPFNKPHQMFMFLSFRNRQADARRWLATLVEDNRVATTKAVADHNDRYRALKAAHGEPGRLRPIWMGVGLTSWGLVTLHQELAADLAASEAFWRGPLGDGTDARGNRLPPAALLGDPRRSDPARWVIGGPDQEPVDALLTLAADDPDELRAWAEEERQRAEALGLVVAPVPQPGGGAGPGQLGEVLRPPGRDTGGVEHFGFRDGVSQPGVRGFTTATFRHGRWESKHRPGSPIIATGEFVLGYPGERGSYLGGRRPNPPEWMWNGSFQVFLRLNQDVAGWWEQMDDLRRRWSEDIAAKVIGRQQDGTPLAPGGGGQGHNEFDYGDDLLGEHTPRFAHIRRANPRDDDVYNDRSLRLLRRGIPFGPFAEDKNAAERDPVERGLLLNAFMASIEDQFEFVQRNWFSNSDRLPVTPGRGGPQSDVTDGPDPLIGANAHHCTLHRVGQAPERLDLGRFVHTSGAVYAFAPSISALRRLVSPKKLRDR
jgi:Dyp-type peroxidase family